MKRTLAYNRYPLVICALGLLLGGLHSLFQLHQTPADTWTAAYLTAREGTELMLTENSTDPQVLRSLLHLPDYVFPAVMLVFGWPTQQQKDRPKPQRCAMEHIVHENGYRTMDGAELRDAFGYKASTSGFDAWCTAFHNRKYDSGFAREMSRSVAEYLEQYK